MKTTHKYSLVGIACLAACVLGLTLSESKADVSTAREIAYRIAAKLRVRGFILFPSDSGDNSKDVQTLEIPISKGLDYTFVVASDTDTEYTIFNEGSKPARVEFKPELDIDLYVEDEEGTQIVADTRKNPDAAVQFTSMFNGIARIKLVFAKDGESKQKVYRRYFTIMGVRGKDPI